MEWGIAINLREHVSEILEKAKIADNGRIDTIWVTDYPATRYSPVLASIIAQNTSNCRIGIGLLSPFVYPPKQILQMMTTLIETYGERFDLLLGPGDRVKLGEIGISYGNISTLIQRIQDCIYFLQEGLVNYQDCRIFLAAQGPKMIETSICSDGVLLNYSDPEMIQWAVSLIKQRPENFKIGIFPPSLVGYTEHCTDHMGIKTSASVVALGLSSSLIKRFGLGENLQEVFEEIQKQGFSDVIVNQIDSDVLKRFYLCGNIKSVLDRIEQYQRTGVDKIVFGPPQGATLEGVELLEKIISKF